MIFLGLGQNLSVDSDNPNVEMLPELILILIFEKGQYVDLRFHGILWAQDEQNE